MPQATWKTTARLVERARAEGKSEGILIGLRRALTGTESPLCRGESIHARILGMIRREKARIAREKKTRKRHAE